jgi:hypothetical protein
MVPILPQDLETEIRIYINRNHASMEALGVAVASAILTHFNKPENNHEQTRTQTARWNQSGPESMGSDS